MQNLQTTFYKKQLFTELAKYNIHQPDEGKCLYKYVSMHTARLILGNHSMKFSTSIELDDNDLENCLLYHNYSQRLLQQERKSQFNNIFKEQQYSHGLNLHNRQQRRRQLHKSPLGKALKKEFSTDIFRKALIDAFENEKNNIGLFCATTSSHKKYMWESEKYGDCERGFCIEYKFQSLYNSLFNAYTVGYDNEMKPLNYLDNNDKVRNVSVIRFLCTKRKSYSEEDEIRLLSGVGKVGIIPVPIEVFTGLYYGKQTPQAHIDELDLLINEVGYSFRKAEKATY